MTSFSMNSSRKRDRVSLGGVLAILAGVLVVVLGPGEPGFGQKAGARPGEIAIAVVLPITGREAKPGQYQRDCAR